MQDQDIRSTTTSHHTQLECKGRQSLVSLPSVDPVYPVAADQEEVSWEGDITSVVERLRLVEQHHREAKAVKSDDAEVPTHLWDSFVTRGGNISIKCNLRRYGRRHSDGIDEN